MGPTSPPQSSPTKLLLMTFSSLTAVGDYANGFPPRDFEHQCQISRIVPKTVNFIDLTTIPLCGSSFRRFLPCDLPKLECLVNTRIS